VSTADNASAQRKVQKPQAPSYYNYNFTLYILPLACDPHADVFAVLLPIPGPTNPTWFSMKQTAA
jgi:hypothetical protein